MNHWTTLCHKKSLNLHAATSLKKEVIEESYLGWRDLQNGVNKEVIVVLFTRVILKRPCAPEPLCTRQNQQFTIIFESVREIARYYSKTIVSFKNVYFLSSVLISVYFKKSTQLSKFNTNKIIHRSGCQSILCSLNRCIFHWCLPIMSFFSGVQRILPEKKKIDVKIIKRVFSLSRLGLKILLTLYR